jgi:hypothetical protein
MVKPLLVVHACGHVAVNADPGQMLGLALAGLLAFAFLRAARVAWRAHRGTALAHRLPARALNDAPHTWAVRSDRLFAFTAGWIQPRVFISDAALLRLDADQRNAVLEHEQCHRRRRDPLRLALRAIAAEAFFFLPGVARVRRHLDSACEVQADAAALHACDGRPQPLAGALLIFDGDSDRETAVEATRIDHLLGIPRRSDLRARLVSQLVACAALFAGLAAIGLSAIAVNHALQLCAASVAAGILAAPAIARLVIAPSLTGARYVRERE